MKKSVSKKTSPRVPTALKGLINRNGQLTTRGYAALNEGLDTALAVLEAEGHTDAFKVLYAMYSTTGELTIHPRVFAFLDSEFGTLDDGR